MLLETSFLTVLNAITENSFQTVIIPSGKKVEENFQI